MQKLPGARAVIRPEEKNIDRIDLTSTTVQVTARS